ncbi:MAG: zinc ribbon domain-containing protein [Sedimentisphaerales bacterium]|nr:zinc ribbon domain-containing protein [Sedimentisphaerales bacterium]
MPTYEYLCGDCHHRFERFQTITEPPLKTCPRCGGSVRRLLGAGSALLVKGSGSAANAGTAGIPPTRCGRDRPCCGRDGPCDLPPCDTSKG